MPSKKTKLMTQQEFLRHAITQLKMTRSEFAHRLNASERRINNWMLPTESKGFRDLDPTIWQFIREILKTDLPK
jgi:hypothetical protein